MKRKIVQIDEHKCNGCGLCVDACHEGAIEMVNGKARLLSDIYCDGLGDCLGECPVGAITIIEREADPYNDQAVQQRAREKQTPNHRPAGGGCPGIRAMSFDNEPAGNAAPAMSREQAPASRLRQWPVQLSLVPVNAPYWEEADILLAADCVAYALGDFQTILLQGRRLAIACPKLDQKNDDYREKLTAILKNNNVRSVTVAYMEVPCCLGLLKIAEQAIAASGKAVKLEKVKVGIQGQVNQGTVK